MIVRPVTPRDAPGMLALQAACYPPELHDSAEDVAAERGYCAVADDVIVGAVVVRGNHLYSIAVHPSHRRTGVARALMAALPDMPMTAHALPDGRALLLSLGWHETGDIVDVCGHRSVAMARGQGA